MQQRDYSKSQQRINKMQSSMIAFRELIQSLRVRNTKNAQKSQHAISQIQKVNPELDSQTNSRLYASENAIDNQKLKGQPQLCPKQFVGQFKKQENKTQNKKEINLISASFSMPLIEDQGLKIKIRGNVAGRDILNKKQQSIHSSKFNQILINNRDQACNKNIIVRDKPKTPQDINTEQAVQQLRILLHKKNSNSSERATQQRKEGMIVSQFNNKSFTEKLTMPNTPKIAQLNLPNTSQPKFQQNKFNVKAVATRNKIKDIDENIIIKYCKQSERLNQNSKANQIFDFFQGLMSQANVVIISPFIKKFKNCVYFGSPIQEDDIYQGFLYFYEGRFYYGQFMKNQKHGKGIQIVIDQQAIYKGIFKQGQKTGKFWVKKLDQVYIGFLEKGLFHGQGKLETKQSVYQGAFQNGQKHGFGEEVFKKTGVKMIGYFDCGCFTKRSKSSFSHNELQKGIRFKTPNYSNKNSRLIKKINRNKKSQNEQLILPNQNQFKIGNQINFEHNHLQISHNSFHPRRTLFNKEKISSFLPGMNQKFIEPMPENCKEYDYSFDATSKKQSDIVSLLAKNKGTKQYRKQFLSKINNISQTEQEKLNNLDTSNFQEPLPIPCFFKR